MGYFVTDEVDRIELEVGSWVDIKRRMSYGDQQKLMGHFIKLSADMTTPDIDLASGNILMLVINIKAWNLTDDKGKEVKLSQGAIEKLEPAVAERIALAINDRNQPPKA